MKLGLRVRMRMTSSTKNACEVVNPEFYGISSLFIVNASNL